MAEKRVLVVEDDRASRDILMRLLVHRHIEADAVNSAEEALNLDLDQYSLCILDLALPGMDGFGLLRQIQTSNNPPPVIAITAYYDSNVVQQAYQAGFLECFPKPASNTMLDQMEKFIRRD